MQMQENYNSFELEFSIELELEFELEFICLADKIISFLNI